jgi:hypothetical protein
MTVLDGDVSHKERDGRTQMPQPSSGFLSSQFHVSGRAWLKLQEVAGGRRLAETGI